MTDYVRVPSGHGRSTAVCGCSGKTDDLHHAARSGAKQLSGVTLQLLFSHPIYIRHVYIQSSIDTAIIRYI